jgi:hypothetical protein
VKRTASGQKYSKDGLRPLPRLSGDEVARLLSPFLDEEVDLTDEEQNEQMEDDDDDVQVRC